MPLHSRLVLTASLVQDGVVSAGEVRATATGACLELPFGDTGDGSVVWMMQSTGGEEQQWLFDGSTIKYAKDPSKCLDVPDISDGTQIQLRTCNGQPQQQLGYDPSQQTIFMVNSIDASKCLVIADDSGEPGTPVFIWDCDGSTNGKWTIETPAPPPPVPPVPPGPPPAPPALKAFSVKSSQTGMCLDLPGGDTLNGNMIWTWGCSDGVTQAWSFTGDSLVYAADPTKCLDVPGGDFTPGKQVELWDCNGYPQQKWQHDDAHKTIYATEGDKCLQVKDASGTPGTKVVIWDCISYQNQEWTLEETHVPAPTPPVPPPPTPPTPVPTVVNVKAGETTKCLDLPGGDVTGGNGLWMWECDASPRQNWIFKEDQMVYAADPNKCVDVPGADFKEGNTLEIWDCLGVPQQKWGYDEHLQSIYLVDTSNAPSWCMAIHERPARDGTPVELRPCAAPYDLNQKFYVQDISPSPPTPTPPVPPPSPPVPPPSPPVPPPAPSLTLKSKDTGLCLDLPASCTDDGQALWTWECLAGADNQKWRFDQGHLVPFVDGSKCVDVPDNDLHNGHQLQLWTCTGQPQQMWNPDDASGAIQLTNRGKCLAIKDSSRQLGTPVEIWDCLPYPNQQWDINSAVTFLV